MRKNIFVFFLSLSSISILKAQNSDASGFFIWDEATSNSVIEAAIAKGVKSFRSRDLTILKGQPAWNVFAKYGKNVDVMVSIPINNAWTTTPVDMVALAKLINENPFIRRLQIYPKLQPGLMNPSELDPCKDWLTGYAAQFEARIREIDNLVTDKTVEILVAGQLSTNKCADLTQIVNTLYDLQSKGRKVAWAVTVYPYFYGNQDNTMPTLVGDVNGVLANLALLAPAGKATLPLRVIETGWPSACSAKATQENQCGFANTVFSYSQANVKLYMFELQDYALGWSECEKHFGLWDKDGNDKCPAFTITGIEENNLEELVISPNPAKEELNIQLKSAFSSIEMYDINGKLALSINNLNTVEYNLNTTSLSPGLYTLRALGPEVIFHKRIVIE